jgi:26S proteasome regulatory subunit N8
MSSDDPDQVIVHPLVLLNVVDHYNRKARDTQRRVVGVLLGESDKGRVDCTNSFAVPFEEDSRDKTVWFLDHDFLEEMAHMFKRINVREKIVGFYSTGPLIKPADLNIADLVSNYCKNPVFAIIDIRAEREEEGLPVKAYSTVEKVSESGGETEKVFKYIRSEVGAFDAEEVGVEHLLRDINDASTSNLAEQIKHKVSALHGLQGRLQEMTGYLDRVYAGELPINNEIIANMQNIMNLFPNLNLEGLIQSIFVKSNDMYLVIYISSIIRSVTALHDLLQNKIRFDEATLTSKSIDEKVNLSKGTSKDEKVSTKDSKK